MTMRNPTPCAKDDVLALCPGALCKRAEWQGESVYVVYREDGSRIAVARNASAAWRTALYRLEKEIGETVIS